MRDVINPARSYCRRFLDYDFELIGFEDGFRELVEELIPSKWVARLIVAKGRVRFRGRTNRIIRL